MLIFLAEWGDRSQITTIAVRKCPPPPTHGLSLSLHATLRRTDLLTRDIVTGIMCFQLASHMNPFGVTVGAILGHSFCTGLAVVGGSLIAKRISQRVVAATGGMLFFTFAFLAAVYGAPGLEG